MLDYIADNIGLKNCTKCELVMMVPFKEDHHWYFQLRYHATFKNGEEGEIIIPKVNSPFRSTFPMIETGMSELFAPVHSLALITDSPQIEKTTYEGHEVYCYYVKTKDAPVKEMTHEEIEEKLGYPFKEVKKKKGEK